MGVPTTTASRPPVRHRWSRCAPSNAACPTSSTTRCSTTRREQQERAREGNGATNLTPARPAHNPNTGSSDKPLRDPSNTSREPISRWCLDTEGSHEGKAGVDGSGRRLSALVAPASQGLRLRAARNPPSRVSAPLRATGRAVVLIRLGTSRTGPAVPPFAAGPVSPMKRDEWQPRGRKPDRSGWLCARHALPGSGATP
jgi:hypothetical protein